MIILILQLRKLRLRDRKCLVQLQQRGPARVGVGKLSPSPPGKVFWVEGTAWAKALGQEQVGKRKERQGPQRAGRNGEPGPQGLRSTSGFVLWVSGSHG